MALASPSWDDEPATRSDPGGSGAPEALAFMPRLFVITTLPHRRPQGHRFERVNGWQSLRMVAPRRIGLPYGVYPRLVLMFLATEATTPLEASRSRHYEGRYQAWEHQLEVLLLNGTLVMIDPFDTPALADMPRLEPVEGHTFRLHTQDGYRAPEELVVFEEDDRGRIGGLAYSGDTLPRTETW